MDEKDVRIDIGREGDAITIDIWAVETRYGNGHGTTWKLHSHDVIQPATVEKVPPGESDPRD
jgi:hypothetical protein